MDSPCPIIYEDKHLLVVNKLPGFVVQGTSDENNLWKALKEYIKHRDQKPGDAFLAVVHRLDKLVSGALVFAKRSKAASRLSQAIREGKFLKVYLAIAEGVPAKEGFLFQKFFWDHKRKKAIVKKPSLSFEGKSCITFLKVLKKKKGLSIVLLAPITGRKHQLRAVLSSLKAPIVGDKKYGSKTRLNYSSILLHSLFVSFPHPVKKEEVSFFAPIPRYFPRFYLDKKEFWDFLYNVKKMLEVKVSEDFVSCSTCAWRAVCTKRFHFDNTKPIKCPDYSPDYELIRKQKNTEEKEFDKEKD